MNKKLKTVLIILLCAVSFSIIAVGYAAISENLVVSGSGNLAAQKFYGVYISDVTFVSKTGIGDYSFAFSKPTNFQTEVEITGSNASITYAVTVHNNTDVTYWYLGIGSVSEYGNNGLLDKQNGIFITTRDQNSTSSTLFDTNDWVPPQTHRTFYVTYRYGSSAMGQVSNMVSFNFGLHMDSVQDEFLKILNDKTSETGYYYLSATFDTKYSEEGKTEIANTGDDEELYNTLFGPDIHIDIDGVKTPVNIVISRKNVDGRNGTGDTGSTAGCEYTVFITTDTLGGSSAVVYAASYTCGADGVWYQIGELYEGTASVITYDSEGNKSINIDSWRATEKTYQITDRISYPVADPKAHDTGMLTELDDLMSVIDTNFGNTINNGAKEYLFIPACRILYTYKDLGGRWEQSPNATNMYNPGYDQLERAFIAMSAYLQINNGAQDIRLKDNLRVPRAELIIAVENLYHAYEYYKSVNP